MQVKRFWIRLRHWEYWPLWLTQIPVFIIYLRFALKARSFLFFYNVNPTIPTGGLFGESKEDIHQIFNTDFYPRTLSIDPSIISDFNQFEEWLAGHAINYPIIAKPDIGERGHKVEIIKNASELGLYLRSASQKTLIQDYIDYPLEFSILFYRLPDDSKKAITSICYKVPLHIIGDGERSLSELMNAHDRAFLQFERLRELWSGRLSEIPKNNEKLILETRGNHSKGSMFLNYNHEISDILVEFFEQRLELAKEIHYGRFDIKCTSWEDLRKGKNIKLIEFNGVGGEPAHVYDPALSFWNMVRVMYAHWAIIHNISSMQFKRGFKVPSLIQGVKDFIAYRKRL